MRSIHTLFKWLNSGVSGNVRGILLMAIGTFLSTTYLVFIRLLSRDLPIVEILFLRYLFTLVAIMPWVLHTGVAKK